MTAIFSPLDPTSPLSICAHETAVLIIDYQNMMLSNVGEAGPSLLSIASQLRDWALHKEMSVFHCLVDLRPGARPPKQMKVALRWKMYEDRLAASPALWQEADAIAARTQGGLEQTVWRLPGFFSALESNGLMESLSQKGIKSLLVAGLSTSGCVLSTVRAATDRGYIVTVVEDACFDPVPGLHGMLVAHVFPSAANVTTAREIQDAWKIL